MKLNVLLLNNEPILSNVYMTILQQRYQRIIFVQARNFEEGYDRVISNCGSFDIIIADTSLFPYDERDLFSITDFISFAKRIHVNAKILLTSHADTFTLYHLIKKIDPEGLLVKSDFASEEFLTAFSKIKNGEKHYSATARQSLKAMQMKETYLDTCNRRIISLIAKGFKTKSLPAHLNLSISAIDKRKAQIKEILDIEKGNDEDIIREAKRSGFI